MVITTELVRRIKRQSPQTLRDYWDTDVVGLVLRARPSGVHSWRVRLKSKRWLTLGLLKELTLSEARDAAEKARSKAALGKDPKPKNTATPTLEAFLSKGSTEHDAYGVWAEAHIKHGAEDLARIRASFASLLGMPLDTIGPAPLAKWRTQRLRAGTSKATINRDLNVLRAALGRAVDWEIISVHPMAKVRNTRLDTRGVVRYLTHTEEQALRDALAGRDATLQLRRVRANAWRTERRYPAWPAFGLFSDHLSPLVITALNTGLRRGELFALRWRDIHFIRASLAVHGTSAKSGQTRHIPLNTEALCTLIQWASRDEKLSMGELVFPGVAGQPLVDIKTAWLSLMRRAQLKHFRFHDLRHTFASKLVMLGVDLNTVRELLGHSDIKMVLRYAHLAPEHTAAAVAKLNPPPVKQD